MASSSTVYKDGEAEIISEINVTPLVDVVLVLLVIFMIAAPLLAWRGIMVNAPSTVSGEQVTTPLQVALRRMPDQSIRLYVNGEQQSDYAAVRAELERARQRDADVKAVIAADQEVPYGDLMQAIDQIKQAGIQKFALASKRPQGNQAR